MGWPLSGRVLAVAAAVVAIGGASGAVAQSASAGPPPAKVTDPYMLMNDVARQLPARLGNKLPGKMADRIADKSCRTFTADLLLCQFRNIDLSSMYRATHNGLQLLAEKNGIVRGYIFEQSSVDNFYARVLNPRAERCLNDATGPFAVWKTGQVRWFGNMRNMTDVQSIIVADKKGMSLLSRELDAACPV